MNEFYGIFFKFFFVVSSCFFEFECSYGWIGVIIKEVYVYLIFFYWFFRFVVFKLYEVKKVFVIGIYVKGVEYLFNRIYDDGCFFLK